MNKITQKEFNKIKNKAVSIYYFNTTETTRVKGYCNLSYIQAIEEIQSAQKLGLFCVVVPSRLDRKISEIECEEGWLTGRISYRKLLEIISEEEKIEEVIQN